MGQLQCMTPVSLRVMRRKLSTSSSSVTVVASRAISLAMAMAPPARASRYAALVLAPVGRRPGGPLARLQCFSRVLPAIHLQYEGYSSFRVTLSRMRHRRFIFLDDRSQDRSQHQLGSAWRRGEKKRRRKEEKKKKSE